MRVRTVLAIVIIVFLIAFFIVPIAGGKQGPTTPGTGRVQRLPDAGQPYTPLFDEGISIVGDPALKADNVPVPANYDIERDITFPARAGTGGGDMPEFEPNNVMSFANTATDIPFTCTGTIDAAGDMDWIRVFVTAGEPLQISVHSRIGLFMSPLNPFLDVRRQDGSLLAFNDNISWPDNLNAEVYITPTYTGDMFLVVWSLVPAGSPAHKYILEVWPTTVPIFDSSNVETELNDTTSAADPITLPGAKLGMISVSGDVDWSYFDAPAGATVVVDVHSQIYGLHLDPVVGIFQTYGGEIFSNADEDGRDSRFNIVLPYTGRYYVRVTDNANTGSIFHAYVLSVSLQDGSASPHITKLKYTPSGRLKKVVGYNFTPPAEAVEFAGTRLSIVPSEVNPTTVIKIKPSVDFPPVGAGPVTVVAAKSRRSNPVWPSAP
ncbi:MAG: PPC domain-containing protein [Blastocatellia bacterium]|nr:PPC domain-containing protein [Blastocatellia bacterium]